MSFVSFAPRRRFVPTAAALAVLAGCGGAGKAAFQMPPVPVEVAEVATTAVTDRFRALGTIDAEEIVKVVNEVDGVVRALPFAEGQDVRRGQILARLDDQAVVAEVNRTSALRDQARTTHQRVKQLVDQGAASPQQLDDALAALRVAEANWDAARVRLDKTRIRSPLNGVVGRRMVSPGAFLRTGETITEVASVDPMRIQFSAPERYLGSLKRGAPVELVTTAYPGEMFHGTISVVDPILDPSSRTVQLVAKVPNSKRRLRPGMSADVTAVLAERASAITVPDEAVFAQGDSNFVYVIQADSTVQRRAVVLGTRDAAHAEVTHGLAPGERVVRAGYQKLFPGARVMPLPGGGTAAAGPGGAAPAAAAAPRGGTPGRGAR
jgi:membrane fusion protein (multidrug efflux system)